MIAELSCNLLDAALDCPSPYPNALISRSVLNISDGTENLDLDLLVGTGGRMLIWAGLGDDNEATVVIATRVQ